MTLKISKLETHQPYFPILSTDPDISYSYKSYQNITNVDKIFRFPEIEKGGGEGEEEEEGANELLNPDKKKKAPAEGYESGVTLLFKQAKASDFIMGDKAIHLLNNCHEIVLDEARYLILVFGFFSYTHVARNYCWDTLRAPS